MSSRAGEEISTITKSFSEVENAFQSSGDSFCESHSQKVFLSSWEVFKSNWEHSSFSSFESLFLEGAVLLNCWYVLFHEREFFSAKEKTFSLGKNLRNLFFLPWNPLPCHCHKLRVLLVLLWPYSSPLCQQYGFYLSSPFFWHHIKKLIWLLSFSHPFLFFFLILLEYFYYVKYPFYPNSIFASGPAVCPFTVSPATLIPSATYFQGLLLFVILVVVLIIVIVVVYLVSPRVLIF